MLSFYSYLKESSENDDKVPHGVLVHGDKYFIGVEHETPVKIHDSSLVDTIKKHADQHGYFFEGSGGPADIHQPLFGLKEKKHYAGSWDEARMQKMKKEGVKPENLSFVFSNVDTNWKQGTNRLVKPNSSISDSLKQFFNQKEFFKKHGISVTDDHIRDFLTASSHGMGKNYHEIAQKTPATERNVRSFLGELESVAWPDNWSTKKRTKGPEILVDRESKARNEFVLDHMGPGVYFAGSGHLLQLRDILKSRKEKFKLIGGSQISQ